MLAIIRTLESKTELDVQKDLKDAIEGSDLEVVHDEEVLVVAGLRQEFFGFNEKIGLLSFDQDDGGMKPYSKALQVIYIFIILYLWLNHFKWYNTAKNKL